MSNNMFLVLLVCVLCMAYAHPHDNNRVCVEYYGAAEMVTNCQNVFMSIGRGPRDMASRNWYYDACSNLPNILQCVDTNTEQCENKAAIRNEARSLFNYCDANGWFMKYKDVATTVVSLCCLRRINQLCPYPSGPYDIHLWGTVEEGVASWQNYVVPVFNCHLNGVLREVANFTQCVAASPKDVMFALLMNQFVGQELGYSLKPAQVVQLETVFTN